MSMFEVPFANFGLSNGLMKYRKGRRATASNNQYLNAIALRLKLSLGSIFR